MENITDIMIDKVAREKRYIKDMETLFDEEIQLYKYMLDNQTVKLDKNNAKILLPRKEHEKFAEAISTVNEIVKDVTTEQELIKTIKDQAILHKLRQNRAFQIMSDL